MKTHILQILLLLATTQITFSQHQSPYLLFDEDFTDGEFNDTSTGKWHMGGWAKFDTVNDRENMFMAALRYTGQGAGSGWDALVHWYPNADDIYMDKEFDVCVLWFTAFSDVAGKQVSPAYGVEVAMLEDKWNAPYGHDLSFEAQHTFIKNGAPEGPLQLDANVENSDHVYINGTRNAHHNKGRETAETLGNAYESLVVWRNRLGKYPNIEQWGALNSADYDVNQKMESTTEPIDSNYLLFNHVQIALFDRVKNDKVSSDNSLFRTGYDNSDAQMGVSHVKLGITRVSDFNLDFKVDADDVTILLNNLDQTNTTIRTGDANNDKVTNALDANALVGFMDAPPVTTSAGGTYNPANGNIKLNLENVAYVKISGPPGALNGASPNLTSLPNDAYLKTDSTLVLYTSNPYNVNDVNLGNIATTGLSESDLRLTINYKGSELGRGLSETFDKEIDIVVANNNTVFQSTVIIDGVTFYVPAKNQQIRYKIYSTSGLLLEEGVVTTGENKNTLLKHGFKIIRISNMEETVILGAKQYFK